MGWKGWPVALVPLPRLRITEKEEAAWRLGHEIARAVPPAPLWDP
jgi:hypothetical protein